MFWLTAEWQFHYTQLIINPAGQADFNIHQSIVCLNFAILTDAKVMKHWSCRVGVWWVSRKLPILICTRQQNLKDFRPFAPTTLRARAWNFWRLYSNVAAPPPHLLISNQQRDPIQHFQCSFSLHLRRNNSEFWVAFITENEIGSIIVI